MTAIDRAAEAIGSVWVTTWITDPADGTVGPSTTAKTPRSIAQALADAGLLRPEWATDEAKAVLDAVGVMCRTLFGHLPTLVDDIETAYDAYLASRQVTT